MSYSILAGFAVAAASVIGSLAGLIFKKISHRTTDIFFGFAAGVMLTAAFLGLLPDALGDAPWQQVILAVLGIIAGAAFISVLDKFVPHVHFHNAELKELDNNSETKPKMSRAMLLVVALAIHNIPEGLATGIVFSGGNQNALLVVVSMIIEKLLDGLIVIIPLLAMGMSKRKAFGISLIVASLMLPGVVIGALLGSLPVAVTAFFYAFTFGAIIYVVTEEIIPQSHEHGYRRAATFALIAGILVIALLSLIG